MFIHVYCGAGKEVNWVVLMENTLPAPIDVSVNGANFHQIYRYFLYSSAATQKRLFFDIWSRLGILLWVHKE